MGAAAATPEMESGTPALADWLAVHDGGLPSDFTSHPDLTTLARVLARLDGRVQRMALVVEAMAQLLERQGLLNERQLLTQAEAIDLSDGIADGRQMRQMALTCGQCGRVNLGKRQRCLYCGSEELTASAAGG